MQSGCIGGIAHDEKSCIRLERSRAANFALFALAIWPQVPWRPEHETAPAREGILAFISEEQLTTQRWQAQRDLLASSDAMAIVMQTNVIETWSSALGISGLAGTVTELFANHGLVLASFCPEGPLLQLYVQMAEAWESSDA